MAPRRIAELQERGMERTWCLHSCGGLLLLLTVVLSQECIDCDNQTPAPLKFEDIVPKHYDKAWPPLKDGNAAVVEIKVAVLNIQYVDEEKQVCTWCKRFCFPVVITVFSLELVHEQLLPPYVRKTFAADIFFHQIWDDYRVKIPPNYNTDTIVLDNKWRHHLWTPDTYFKNSLDGKVNDIIIPYSYMTLQNNSKLFFAVRVSLKLSCEMDLAAYPHDVQQCEITIMSLQHKNDTVVLQWKEFQITSSILLAQYYVRGHTKGMCTKTYDIGTFSCLKGRIQLTRRLGYFLINKYIPCVLIVCMSFVTFWVPAEAYPARVTLSVTSLLTIVTQQYQSSMPSVSYVVALNIWMLSCIGFVFFSLLEYAFVISVMNQRGPSVWPFQKLKKMWAIHKSKSGKMDGEAGQSADKSPSSQPSIPVTQSLLISHLTIDKASRIIFPLFFFIFCFSYWMVFSR